MELALSYNPFLLLLVSLLLLLLKWFFVTHGTKKNNIHRFPPSPPRIPIIGNLLQLVVGSHPHRNLRDLARRHGPLMFLWLGKAPTLVVSSADMAQEIMKTHDLVFCDRHSSSTISKISYNNTDLAFSPYGEYWRLMRSICVLQLLSVKRVHSFRRVREEETDLMIQNIISSCSSGCPVDLNDVVISLTNDIICRVAFGRKYSQESSGGQKFKDLLDELMPLLGTFDAGDVFPWLRWLKYVNGLNARTERIFRELNGVMDGVVDDHAIAPAEENQMDLVDVLLQIQQDTNADARATITRDNLKAIILDVFVAGSDTTSTSLQWTFTELLRNPETMKKLQEEIRGIVPINQKVTEDDLKQMNYLKLVIKEALRLHPPIPFLLPRKSTEAVQIQGYYIPSGTRVLINAWAIGRDPEIWEKPEEFWPERFEGSSIDFRGQDFEFIPFGAGRRGCPGISFAMANIELALASFLHKLDWKLPNGMPCLDVTESYGITIHRKFPLLAVATPPIS